MTTPDEQFALAEATQAVLAPLARLLVARGVSFASAQENLKIAMVEAARETHAGSQSSRLVSRIAMTAGVTRREVNRLTQAGGAPLSIQQRSVASEVFTRWRTAPAYCDAQGHPSTLARQGPAPSFESLARSVTQDVHPRSILDELLRLGLATHETGADSVSLTIADFVPTSDRARMLDFLADNVGDHLAAAVANVLGPTPRHVERAVFAHGLSLKSIERAQDWVAQVWQRLLPEVVPFLEQLIAEDDADPELDTNHRFRTGLYAFGARNAKAAPTPPGPVAASEKSKTPRTATPRPARIRSPRRGTP